jgi:Bacterial EndoU nuclease
MDARRVLARLNPQLTARAQTHILDGDQDGGGHRHGVLPPAAERKIWFPESWSDEKCLAVIRDVLASPMVIRWAKQDFLNVYGEVDRVRIKVRVRPDGAVVTAHPIDGAGVVVVHVRADGSMRLRAAPYGRSREVSW